ncbi:hypothetical protein ACFXDJ_33055 [Streptomyces sp. NPDC059443]|uniref:hypothetical protein n=1 Tax=unclassified Streptomyces TaxID=2593676 RepID=UPI003699AAD3
MSSPGEELEVREVREVREVLEVLEAPVTDTVLLVFDGRVLELFGFNDVHRWHVWQRPRIECTEGRRPTLTITLGRSDYRFRMPCDTHRLPGLRALAERLPRD